jgi:hypothetical protein
MSAYIRRWFATPLGLALGVVALAAVIIITIVLAAVIIITIGEMLLSLADPEATQDSINRPELLFALGLAALLLLALAFVANRPEGTTGRLEQPLAIGKEPFLTPPPPPPDIALRRGPVGTVDDIQPGYLLFARNGALARVLGKVPGSNEYGRRFSGYLYAQGVYGASDELWIPNEAVLAVYPETQAAFLAIKGDETEYFGWNKPPSNLARTPSRPEGPKGL